MDIPASQIVFVSAAALTLCFALRSIAARNSLSHIPGPKPTSWWKGWKFHEELYRFYGGAARLDMMLGDQQLFVSDPLALHYICVKEQHVYEETEKFLITNELTFGSGLLATLGDHHKRQRKLLNPVFSLKHMRDLLPTFYPIAHKLSYALESEISKGKECIDVMNWVSRAALEYIGQGGLGYSFDALNEEQSNGYSEAIKAYTPLVFKLKFVLRFLPQAVKLGPPSFRRWVVELVPSGPIKDLVSITDTIEKHSKEILHNKRFSLQAGEETTKGQIGSGKDIMTILMKANVSANGNADLPDAELLGHMRRDDLMAWIREVTPDSLPFVFSTLIVAGHDTTTSAISRILDVLSHNQGAQTRLRDEVTNARKQHGDLDYDTLMALPYLDAVCRETMRLHPPVTHVDRVTRKNTTLPLLWPIMSTDGKTAIKEIRLRKNTTVYVSILGANRNKIIWGEDADEWQPERWLNPLPKSVDEAHLPGVYSQTMTFLGGGRSCIGFKFSEIEMKVVLSVLIEKFLFEPGPEIYWEMGGLHHPVVKRGEERGEGQVPLKVSVVG